MTTTMTTAHLQAVRAILPQAPGATTVPPTGAVHLPTAVPPATGAVRPPTAVLLTAPAPPAAPTPAAAAAETAPAAPSSATTDFNTNLETEHLNGQIAQKKHLKFMCFDERKSLYFWR